MVTLPTPLRSLLLTAATALLAVASAAYLIATPAPTQQVLAALAPAAPAVVIGSR